MAPASLDIGSYLAVADDGAEEALLLGYRDGWQQHRRSPLRDLPAQALRAMLLRSLLARVADPLRGADPAWRELMADRIGRIEALL
ncbi:hypothetical protein [Actinobaculum sp. 313]|uniref:hypothetical protein n=1 Tax=Actinobaculum sp. 313 TaxID=2495645 RepID=UPI001F0C097D|nr:hypothetical protein [Actinobaculum sp. 313]